MILILRPPGRGNWKATVLSLDGPHVEPLLFRVGSRIELAGLIFRVCKVIP